MSDQYPGQNSSDDGDGKSSSGNQYGYGQQNGQPGDQENDPYARPQYGQNPDPGQQDTNRQPAPPYQQLGPYQQSNPYQQPGPYQNNPYQQPGPYQQSNPYQQPGNPYQQPGPYAGYQQHPYGQQPPSKGMAITALVFGIVAIVLCLIPFVGFVSIVGGLAAVVVGIIALVKKKPGRGMALAGVITGGLGMVIAIIITVVSIYVIGEGIQNVSKPRSVEYTVTSNGPAEVQYFDGESDTTEQINGDWTEEINFDGPPLSTVTVTPTGNTSEVSCEIIVNGETVDQQEASGSNAPAACIGAMGAF